MNVTITGSKGYIAGRLFLRLCSHENWQVQCCSIRNELPSFEQVNTVVHAAGLVHQRHGSSEDFDRINRQLTIQLARQAQKNGVRHFIYLSSMAVYGLNGSLKTVQTIEKNTPLRPVTPYGDSKLAAEKALQTLNFPILSIVRPPMVYGPDCTGNYALLKKAAGALPIFPLVDNKRSVIHCDTLCTFLDNLIQNPSSGYFHPQDDEPMNTSVIVQKMAQEQQHKIRLSPLLGKTVHLLPLGVINKIFGSLIYAPDIFRTEFHDVKLINGGNFNGGN